MATVVVENTIQLNELLPIVLEGAYSSLFITPAESLNFVDGKTFKFKQMTVGGYQPSTYTSGTRKTYANVDVNMAEQTFTLSFFREFEHNQFLRDIEYSGGTYDVNNMLETFMTTQDIPETDAYFFSAVADAADTASLRTPELVSTFTRTNVIEKLDVLMNKGKIRALISKGEVVCYCSTTVMNLLARSDYFDRNINVATLTEGHTISTRIARYNSLPIIEVTDEDRFNDSFDFSDGYVADGDTINFLIASPLTTKTVIAFNWLHTFAPGQHTHGASYLTQMEKWMDTFVFNNGLNNTVDSIATSIDASV